MNSDRLRGEYLSALRATTFADLQPLFNAGVGAQAIAMADPAISRVTISGASYQLDPDGGIAWVIPVRVDDPVTPECVDPSEAVSEGAVIDLLAFHPSRPYRWALRV